MVRFIIKCCLIATIFFFQINCEAQKLPKFGLVYKAGVSQNGEPEVDLFNSAVISYGVGIYRILYLGRNPERRGVIDHLKLDLYSLAYRTAYFEIENSTARLTSYFIDVDLIVPLRFAISPQSDVFVGAGPVLSFLISQQVDWIGPAEEVKNQTVQFGWAGEMGIKTHGNSFLGLRVFFGHAKYPVNEVSVFFGLGLADMSNSISKRQEVK